MKKSRMSVITSVATGAALALSGTAGSTPTSASSMQLSSSYEPFQGGDAAPVYPAGISVPANMRVATVRSSLRRFEHNNECTLANIITRSSTPARAMTKHTAGKAMLDLLHWWHTVVDQDELPHDSAALDVSFASISDGTAAPSRPNPISMPPVRLQATTGQDTCFDDNAGEKYHHRSKFRQKPRPAPNALLHRFCIVLRYLADVIATDVVFALLVRACTQLYYRSCRKHRTNLRGRRLFRRWSRFASRMCVAVRDAWLLKRASSSTVRKGRAECVEESPSVPDIDVTPLAGAPVVTSSPARVTAVVSKKTADHAGDVTAQQASRRLRGWEEIGRNAYFEHSYAAQLANLDHIQDYDSFTRKAQIFMAGFAAGSGVK